MKPAGDLNLLILAPVLAFLEARYGGAVLRELAVSTGIPEDTLRKPRGWITLAQFESILAHAREKVGTDAKFLEACSYELVKSYGSLVLVFRALSVLTSYRILAVTAHFVTRISRYELALAKRHSVTLRYTSDARESRLMCLSRQAQLSAVPLMFSHMPPARLRETRCIAHGDDCCEYHLAWGEPLSWRLPAIGIALGLAFALVARRFGVDHVYAGPALGALLGATLAFRRIVIAANDFHGDTTKQVTALVTQHEEAAEELIALHQRQEAFNALLAERIEALLGATHDIRNPLQMALLKAQAIGEMADPKVAEMGKAISDNVQSAQTQMTRMLEIATASDEPFAIENARLEISEFAVRVQKNLQALVITRDIRTSVRSTREAPEAIDTNTMLFGRVIDNLVSNAVKYTDRGSILVEIGGAPGHLTFKISDTGRGISPERLEQVFVGGPRDTNPLLGESHGIGLSIAIRLLDELGGRLEVMSKPEVGTTIWAHVPIRPPSRALRGTSPDEVLRRVVTIKNVANG